MNADVDEFADRLARKLHESLDSVWLDDVPWQEARVAGHARVSMRRWRVLAPVTAVVTAFMAAAIVIVVALPGGHVPPLNASTNSKWHVVEAARLGSTPPALLTAGDGFLFAGSWDTGTVVRLDPATLEETGELTVGSKDDGPLSIAYGGKSLWILNFADGRLWRVDAATMQVTLKVPVGSEPSRVAFGEGAVWVTVCCGGNKSAGRQRLERIDPATGHITGSVTLSGEGEAVPLAVGSKILVASQSSPVFVIDPTTLTVEHRLPGESVPGLAVLGGGLYVAGLNGVSRFDATTGQRTATSQDLTADETNGSLTSGPDGLWLGVDGALVRLDPVTLRVVDRVPLATVTQVVDAHPWVYVSRPGEVLRLSQQRSDDTSTALSMCRQALGGSVASAGLSTLGEIRSRNIGGPPPGVVPGRHAFPALAPSEIVAWCWRQSPASPRDGTTWSWYVVANNEPPERLFSQGQPSSLQPPTGFPSIT